MGATILQDLVVVMVLAAAVTIVFYRLRQPVVLGYLLAGVLVGPHSSRFSLVKDAASIDGLAELGIIFLMFAVGLEFNLKKLRKVGPTVAVAAAIQVSLMIALGYGVGRALGWSSMDSIFLGAIVSISSTTIIVKLLSESGRLKEEHAQVVLGILVVEDLAAITIVAVLSGLGKTGSFDPAVLAGTFGGILLFIFIFVAVCLVLVPRLIDSVSRFHAGEVLVITVVGLAFGAALLAQNVGFSITLGAFLMGAIVGESQAVKRVEHQIAPIRDLFTAVFFVAVGMLIDPRIIFEHAGTILIITLVTIVGKFVMGSVSTFLVGFDGRLSIKTGSMQGQIGEFSFIIAAMGLSLGVVRPELYPISIAVCALTALTTPMCMRAGPKMADALAPRLPTPIVRALMGYTRFIRRQRTPTNDLVVTRNEVHRARHRTRVLIYAAWLLGLLIFAAYVSQWLGAEVGSVLSLGTNAKRASAVGFLGLAGLPLFVAFVKAMEAWSLAGAKDRAMRPNALGRSQSQHRRPRVVARVIASLTSAVFVGVAVWISWGVHPLAVPNTWLLVPVLILVGAVGFLAWEKLERVYVGMEATLNELMGTPADTPSTERNAGLRERLPFGMDVAEIVVRPHMRGAYSSLKSLRLRDQTGATVLSVERRGAVIPNPHPDLIILPGDRLVLVGQRDHLTRGQHVVTSPGDSTPMVAEEMRIPASSPAVGKPLSDVALSSATRVGMVRRADGSLHAPSPRLRLQPDDRVVVYGPEASLQQARERLRVKRLPGATSARRGPG